MSLIDKKSSEALRLIRPHWLLRLFGAKPVQLRLSENQLEIEITNGQRVVVLPDNLAKTKVRRDGFLFADLCLATDQGDILVKGISKQNSLEHIHWLKSVWFAQLAPEMAKLSAELQELLDSGYPRTSTLNQVVLPAKQAVKRFGVVGDKTAYPAVNFKPFESLQFWANWAEADFALLQKNYVSHQLSVHKTFFDKVETKPLTDRQREACVVDEDNNLVLAGAGTGKTSTMVGRAGYLLQSGQAHADEILMLAFANKAAAEMQERLEKRLGDCGIAASTFHKLGKDCCLKYHAENSVFTEFT